MRGQGNLLCLSGLPGEFIGGAAGTVHVERGLSVGGLVLLTQFGLVLKLFGGFGELLLGFFGGGEAVAVVALVLAWITRGVLG